MSDVATVTAQAVQTASGDQLTTFFITLSIITGAALVRALQKIFTMRNEAEDERIKDIRLAMSRHETTVNEITEKKDKRVAERVGQIEERVTAICASKTEKLDEHERRINGIAESHDRLNAYTIAQFAKHDVFRETHATDLKRLERSLEAHKKESNEKLEKLDSKIGHMSEKIDTMKNEVVTLIMQLINRKE